MHTSLGLSNYPHSCSHVRPQPKFDRFLFSKQFSFSFTSLLIYGNELILKIFNCQKDLHHAFNIKDLHYLKFLRHGGFTFTPLYICQKICISHFQIFACSHLFIQQLSQFMVAPTSAHLSDQTNLKDPIS